MSVKIVEFVIGYFDGGKVDFVVCDGVLDVIGLYDMDEFV